MSTHTCARFTRDNTSSFCSIVYKPQTHWSQWSGFHTKHRQDSQTVPISIRRLYATGFPINTNRIHQLNVAPNVEEESTSWLIHRCLSYLAFTVEFWGQVMLVMKAISMLRCILSSDFQKILRADCYWLWNFFLWCRQYVVSMLIYEQSQPLGICLKISFNLNITDF